jgi:hypothetical protein
MTDREAGPLDEPAVGVVGDDRVVGVVVVADAERGVAAQRAVRGLIAGVERDRALDAPGVVVGRTVVGVAVEPLGR